MNSKFLLICLGVILVFLLSGIAFASVNQTTTTQKQSATQINVWYFENGAAENLLLDKFNQFASTNGVTINATKVTPDNFAAFFDQYYYNDSYRPNLIEVKNSWVADLAAKGQLVQLDGNLESQSDYVNASLRALSYFDTNGLFHVYGFPYSMDTIMGFANKQVLTTYNADLPPTDSIWSWDQWLKSVSLSNNQVNVNDPHYGFSFTDTPGSFDAFLYGMGGRLFKDYHVDTPHVGIQSNASVSALQLASDVVNTKHLTPSVDMMGTTSTRNLFMAGKVATIFDYFSGLNNFLSNATFNNNNLMVYQVPEITNGLTGGPLVVDGFSVVKNAPADVQASSIALGKFLSGTDVQGSLTSNHLKIPVRSSALETVKDEAYYKPFLEGLARSYQAPISNFWQYSTSVYADRVWTYLAGEPAYSSEAALSIAINMDKLPNQDNSPTYKPANFPDFFPGKTTVTTTQTQTTVTTETKSTPGFESIILIPTFLGIVAIMSLRKHYKKKN